MRTSATCPRTAPPQKHPCLIPLPQEETRNMRQLRFSGDTTPARRPTIRIATKYSRSALVGMCPVRVSCILHVHHTGEQNGRSRTAANGRAPYPRDRLLSRSKPAADRRHGWIRRPVVPPTDHMNELCFCITTTDRTVLNRWLAAFKKEGWDTVFFDSLRTACACVCAGRAELDLVEVGAEPGLCRTPEELQEVILARKPIATLIFSSQRNISNSQAVKFLESGADDFLYSDLDERVIVAKLRTHLRRLAPLIAAAAAAPKSSDGEILVDSASRIVRVRCAGGRYKDFTNLTQKELVVLALLVRNERKAVTRRDMLEKIWGAGAGEVYPNCISQHIETLRKKLGPYAKRIKTVYGSGYMFI